jgi:hypothetical protein
LEISTTDKLELVYGVSVSESIACRPMRILPVTFRDRSSLKHRLALRQEFKNAKRPPPAKAGRKKSFPLLENSLMLISASLLERTRDRREFGCSWKSLLASSADALKCC